jgi:recombination protein RecA
MSENLSKVLSSIDKKYGKGTVVNFEDTVDDVKFISSGSLSLDIALGGGYPSGRVIEVYGPESSGKSTLALSVCVEIQKLGGSCLYIDGENAFDRDYAKNLGIDFSKDKWLFSQPECGEQSFDIIEEFLSIPEIGIIVVDSVATMIPQAELDGDFGDSKMGLHARLMSQGLRKIVSKVKKSNCIVFFINQTRDKIGCVSPKTKINFKKL